MRKKFSVLFCFIFSAVLVFGCVSTINYNMMPFMSDGKYDRFFSFDGKDIGEMKKNVEKSAVWLVTKIVIDIEGEKKEIPISPQMGTAFIVSFVGECFPKGRKFVLALNHITSRRNSGDQLMSSLFSIKEAGEITYLLYEGREIKLPLVFSNAGKDIALFELPGDINIPALPYVFGNSNELELGNAVCLLGRPMNTAELNPREGLINGLSFLRTEKLLLRYGERDDDTQKFPEDSVFVSTIQILPGDSGGLVFASRDGKKELVGLMKAFMVVPGAGFSISLRINSVLDVIREHFNNLK